MLLKVIHHRKNFLYVTFATVSIVLCIDTIVGQHIVALAEWATVQFVLFNTISKYMVFLHTHLFLIHFFRYQHKRVVYIQVCHTTVFFSHLLDEEEPSRRISTRQTQIRVGSLMVWALSESYIKLRKKLGIAISA